jgi:hypothetical protein
MTKRDIRLMGRASLCAVAAGMVAALSAQTPSTPPASAKPFVAIGCLSRAGGAAGKGAAFTLTDSRGDKPTMYRVEGDEKLLGLHVGHQVEVSGQLSAGASANPAMKVASLVYISPTCPKTK